MAEALLARAEVIEQHLEGQGSEVERETLLPKLEGRVKAAAAKPPTNKENQENERALAPKDTEKKKEKVREKKPERFAPLLAPLPRIAPIAYVPWEETVPWDAWSMPQCMPCPTGQAEFFPGLAENGVHTDQLWSPSHGPTRRDVTSIREDDAMSTS